MIAAQQIGVTFGDAPAAKQAKSDHPNFLCWPELPGRRKMATERIWDDVDRGIPGQSYIQNCDRKSRRLDNPPPDRGWERR
jgi:hypothetical protein